MSFNLRRDTVQPGRNASDMMARTVNVNCFQANYLRHNLNYLIFLSLKRYFFKDER